MKLLGELRESGIYIFFVSDAIRNMQNIVSEKKIKVSD